MLDGSRLTAKLLFVTRISPPATQFLAFDVVYGVTEFMFEFDVAKDCDTEVLFVFNAIITT